MRELVFGVVLGTATGCAPASDRVDRPADALGGEAGAGASETNGGAAADGTAGGASRGGASGLGGAGEGLGGEEAAGGDASSGRGGATQRAGTGGQSGSASGGGAGGSGGSAAGLLPRACAVSEVAPDAACAGADAAPIDAPIGLAEELHNLVLEVEWKALWGTVGQYACGDASVYRGTFTANDGEEDWQDAIASLVTGAGLEWIATPLEGPHLTVFGPTAQRRTRLTQASTTPGVTETSIIVDYDSSFGVRAACTDCVVDLSTHPDALALDYLATGEFGSGAELRIQANGSFEKVPSEDVTFADIQAVTQVYSSEIAGIIDAFEPCGAELVRRVSREHRELAPPPPGSGFGEYDCFESVRFSAIWYLDPQAPGRHGIRALELEEPAYCCEPWQNETGEAPVCFD